MMDCNDIDDLLPAFILGTVSPDERHEVQRHLATCSRHPQLAELERVVELMPMSIEPVAPRSEVKHRLMARVYRDLEPRVAGRTWRSAWGWLAAAAMALVALGFGIRDFALSKRLASAPLQWQLQPASAGVATAGTLVWSPSQHTATLTLQQLPALPPGDVYEVWLIKGGTPTPAGVFGIAGDRSGSVIINGDPAGYDTVAVTLEPGPAGSHAPTSAPFVSAKLS